MRRFLIFLVVLLALSACNDKENKNFTISVTVIGEANGGIAILRKFDGFSFVGVDTQVVKNGGIVFTGRVYEAALYAISLKDFGSYPFFLENAEYSGRIYTDSIEKSQINGGTLNAKYSKYFNKDCGAINGQLVDVNANFQALVTNTERYNEKEALAYLDALESLLDVRYGLVKNTIKKNRDNVLGAYIAYSDVAIVDLYSNEKVMEVYKMLSPKMRESIYGKCINECIAKLKKNSVGEKAPEFVLRNENGKAISLSELLRENDVLIFSFWTTWNPSALRESYLRNITNQYASQKVKVVTISCDGDRDRWVKYVTTNPNSFVNLIDEPGQPVFKMYAVNRFPRLIVVGKDGKIKAQRIRSDKLSSLVDSLVVNK